jgi:hypothetical protein
MADADKNDFLLSWIVVCRSFPICLHRAFRAIIELPSSQSEGCAAAALDTDDRQDSGLLHRDPQSLSYNVSSLSRGGELWKEDAFSSVMVSYPAVVMSPFFFIPRRTGPANASLSSCLVVGTENVLAATGHSLIQFVE